MIRLFRHYIPRTLLVLVLIEALILFYSIYLGKSLRALPYQSVQPELFDVFPMALVFMSVMVVILIGMGLYERYFWSGMIDMVLRIGVGFLLGLFVMTLIYYLFPGLYLGRGEFGLAYFLAFGGVVLTRFVFLHLFNRDHWKRRILVLGAEKKAAEIEQLARDGAAHGFTIVGYIPLPGQDITVDPRKVLHSDKALPALVEQYRVDEIVVALSDRRRGFPTDEILECKISGVEIVDLLTFLERETGKINLDSLYPSNIVFSDGFHQAVLKTSSKRLFDILASSFLLLLTWPIMLVTALVIWVESGGQGPIFYRQERVGKGGRPFEVIKFRSMRVDAEADGLAQWATLNDSRVTRVGSFIRKTRIDELPQLICVFLGYMSFVGPRPERPQFVNLLSQKIPFYSMRHRVNPGITGWAQICYPYGASEQDAREKLQYDLYYIKNYSLFLDLMVLLETAYVILWGRGAR